MTSAAHPQSPCRRPRIGRRPNSAAACLKVQIPLWRHQCCMARRATGAQRTHRHAAASVLCIVSRRRVAHGGCRRCRNRHFHCHWRRRKGRWSRRPLAGQMLGGLGRQDRHRRQRPGGSVSTRVDRADADAARRTRRARTTRRHRRRSGSSPVGLPSHRILEGSRAARGIPTAHHAHRGLCV